MCMLSHTHFQFKYSLIFSIGVPSNTRDQELIAEENEIYGDILQADYIDAYRNITTKVSCLHIAGNCSKKWRETHGLSFSLLIEWSPAFMSTDEGLQNYLTQKYISLEKKTKGPA